MAGGADNKLAAGACVGLLGSLQGGGSCISVQMHAVGPGIEGHLRGTIDEDAGFAGGGISGAHGFHNARGERLQFAEREIFFANLDEIHSSLGPQAHELYEAIAAGGFVAGEDPTTRDGVEKHLNF